VALPLLEIATVKLINPTRYLLLGFAGRVTQENQHGRVDEVGNCSYP